MNQLEQLKKMTVIVADTGDIDAIRTLIPRDATTNPSLLLAAAQKPEYSHLIQRAITDIGSSSISARDKSDMIIDQLCVNFGVEILNIIPGRVSTEIDARLSFDTDKSVKRAKHIIRLYENRKIPRERILIKLASTWEGIRAAELLEMEGIHCNMTLLFSLHQAIACAEAKATLISPFVGRILDWYKKHENVTSYPPEKDPGVLSVKEIYTYLKKFNYPIEVMGASFRNKDEIIELAGCDLLTISPQLLHELQSSKEPVAQKLSIEKAQSMHMERISLTESEFRYYLNDNAMATEKLAEGIRNFAKDLIKLQEYIQKKFL